MDLQYFGSYTSQLYTARTYPCRASGILNDPMIGMFDGYALITNLCVQLCVFMLGRGCSLSQLKFEYFVVHWNSQCHSLVLMPFKAKRCQELKTLGTSSGYIRLQVITPLTIIAQLKTAYFIEVSLGSGYTIVLLNLVSQIYSSSGLGREVYRDAVFNPGDHLSAHAAKRQRVDEMDFNETSAGRAVEYADGVDDISVTPASEQGSGDRQVRGFKMIQCSMER